MSSAAEPRRYTVIYDPNAVAEFVVAVKSKQEQKAMLNVVDKLRTLGERLPPPHTKPLQGQAAAGLRELRPRRGSSDWRALYRRYGSLYIVLSIDRHSNFAALTARAQERARSICKSRLNLDKP